MVGASAHGLGCDARRSAGGVTAFGLGFDSEFFEALLGALASSVVEVG
jgi:hypothetical protein